jgi:Alpha/beta hydrolase of unknown function (DUF900)
MNELDKKHCVVVKKGKFDTDGGSSAADLRGIFDAISQTTAPVVLHFHGGLVNKQAGITAANLLTPLYTEAGTYPVFFIWESGWEEVIKQNLPAIFQERLFKRILFRVTQFAKAKIDKGVETGQPKAAGGLALPGVSEVQDELRRAAKLGEPYAHVETGTLPYGDELTATEQAQFEATLREDEIFAMAASEVARPPAPPDATQPRPRSATSRGRRKSLMSAEVVRELTTEKGGKGVISTGALIARCSLLLAAVVKRFANRRDHGFYLTIVEETLRAFYAANAGRFLWDGMKRSIVDSFGVAAGCGGSQFLSELKDLWSSGKRRRITIVGHSAGAIYACHFLQELQGRGLPSDLHVNVILIAPACDFGLLAKTLQVAGDRVDGLRVFGMSDDRERRDAIAPGYPSSLLYFVSGVIEEQDDCPLAGMSRYYTAPYDTDQFAEINYVRGTDIFKREHALVWSPSLAGDGYNCDMTTHGGWVKTKATVASVVHILAQGYA